MTNSLDSDSQPENIPTNDIDQEIGENQGLVVGQASGSTVIGSIHNYYHAPDISNKAETVPLVLGENPYKGLEAFEEEDRDRFFGRDTEIKGENGLLKKFQDLRDDQNAIRILPVYGASGSGKSSLVKAGLVPILRDGLKEGDRLVLMKPSGDPISELAKVLAHNIIDKPVLVDEIRDFKTWLLEQNEVLTNDGKKDKDFDGLHRIIDSAKGVKSLILVIDQFEEVYTYGTPQDQRDAFVYNLLCAANAANYFSRKVSVILTMRIDFVGKTHEYSSLNKLFASPTGVYVPIMQREQLAIAISEPAKRAGHTFTEETIDLLLEQSRGQEGALPLLQFALTQIWEGLLTEITPADTLRKIGGVGGALANKAQEAYDSLKTEQEKQITRAIFLKLILLNVDNRPTRRRVLISDLVTGDHKEKSVREVIAHFTQSKVRILVTSAPIDNPKLERVEIAHEALIDNWEQLRGWLRENEQAIFQRDEIEKLREKWERQDRSKDYLLEGRILRDTKEFQEAQKDNLDVFLSDTAKEFLQASIKKQITNVFKSIGIFVIFPAIITIISIPSILGLIENIQVDRAKNIVFEDNCEPSPNSRGAIEYLIQKGYKSQLFGIKLCKENLPNIDFSGSDLSGSDLREANLGGAKFQKTFLMNAKLQRAELINADLSGAFLRNAQMQETQLQIAVLKGAFLSDANLQKAGLEKADLSGADLSGADLSGAILSNTNLSGSNLSGTKFSKAVLINTVLIDSKGISIQELSQAKKICGTKLSSQVVAKQPNEVVSLKKIQDTCDKR